MLWVVGYICILPRAEKRISSPSLLILHGSPLGQHDAVLQQGGRPNPSQAPPPSGCGQQAVLVVQPIKRRAGLVGGALSEPAGIAHPQRAQHQYQKPEKTASRPLALLAGGNHSRSFADGSASPSLSPSRTDCRKPLR